MLSQVAEVAIEALFQANADNKIVEIVGSKSGSGTPKDVWFDIPMAPSSGCATPVWVFRYYHIPTAASAYAYIG